MANQASIEDDKVAQPKTDRVTKLVFASKDDLLGIILMKDLIPRMGKNGLDFLFGSCLVAGSSWQFLFTVVPIVLLFTA